MAELIYGLCALTSLLCAFLLLRAYASGKYQLLFWSGLCFAGLAVNNVLLVIDKLVLRDIDLTEWRLGTAFVAMLVLLYGLILKAK